MMELESYRVLKLVYERALRLLVCLLQPAVVAEFSRLGRLLRELVVYLVLTRSQDLRVKVDLLERN